MSPTSARATVAGIQLTVAFLLILLARRHADILGTGGQTLNVIFALSFIWLAIQIGLSFKNLAFRPAGHHSRKASADGAGWLTRRELALKRVTVVVPVYNEDAVALRACLESLAAQTRAPDRVHVVDDGSSDDLAVRDVIDEVRARFPGELVFTRQDNSGKRLAQKTAFDEDLDAWVFVTLDSDTVLDENAIESLLHAFSAPEVTVVGGILLGHNGTKNLLTRLVDIGFTCSFLNGRAAWSSLGSVVVHCGGLAAYRADVIRKYLPFYVSQTVFGRAVTSGDDRMLTTLALMNGRSVTQESAVGYTLLPENISHLTRQRLRWWRSFFWGGLWLIRHMPMTRLAWWLVAWQYVMFAMYTIIVPLVFLVIPLKAQRFPWEMFAYLALIAYLRMARYVTVRRPGESLGSRLAIYALTPVSSLLHLYLCSGLQYVGLATVAGAKWGTRSSVEVGIDPYDAAARASAPAPQSA